MYVAKKGPGFQMQWGDTIKKIITASVEKTMRFKLNQMSRDLHESHAETNQP